MVPLLSCSSALTQREGPRHARTAGQDNRLRLWSLRTGRQVLPSSAASFSTGSAGPSTFLPPNAPNTLLSPVPTPSSHPLLRTFPAPLRALAFSPLDPARIGTPSYAERLPQGLDAGGGGGGEGAGAGAWGCPSLWAADGAAVEGFGVR